MSFAVDPYLGIITSIKSLDYEEQILHTLTIMASDSVHKTEAQITVEVLDVNDNAPVFSQEYYQVGSDMGKLISLSGLHGWRSDLALSFSLCICCILLLYSKLHCPYVPYNRFHGINTL